MHCSKRVLQKPKLQKTVEYVDRSVRHSGGRLHTLTTRAKQSQQPGPALSHAHAMPAGPALAPLRAAKKLMTRAKEPLQPRPARTQAHAMPVDKAFTHTGSQPQARKCNCKTKA